jgi:hypothetical protein
LFWLSGIIVGVLAVEMLLRLPVIKTAVSVLARSQDSLRVIRSNDIPEEQKQGLVLQNSWQAFKNTCLLALQILVLALVLGGLSWLLSRIFSIEGTLIHNSSFLISATVTSLVYVVLRKRFVRP